MFLIYIQVDGNRAVYHSEYNRIEDCREAMLTLAEAGKRVHFSTQYLGPEIKVF
jgi:hypothetical protein